MPKRHFAPRFRSDLSKGSETHLAGAQQSEAAALGKLRREFKKHLGPIETELLAVGLKRHRKKISSLVKSSPPNSGERGVTQETMKSNDADLPAESQHELAAGVLKQAAHDLRRFHQATTKIERKLYLDAYCWLTANEFFYPFSFLNVCHTLSLAPEAVRAELISNLSIGTFNYWRRRLASAIALLVL